MTPSTAALIQRNAELVAALRAEIKRGEQERQQRHAVQQQQAQAQQQGK